MLCHDSCRLAPCVRSAPGRFAAAASDYRRAAVRDVSPLRASVAHLRGAVRWQAPQTSKQSSLPIARTKLRVSWIANATSRDFSRCFRGLAPVSGPGGGIALVAHSGGPTPVINASLWGVVEEARNQRQIAKLYGARYGLDGVLREDFIDLFAQSAHTLEAIAAMPSSALGTSRLEAGRAEIEEVLRVFRTHDIRFLFYTGGNGCRVCGTL